MNQLERRGGFTLVEILIVIVILGILAGIVGLSVISFRDEATINQMRGQVHAVRHAITFFRSTRFNIPNEDLWGDSAGSLTHRTGNLEPVLTKPAYNRMVAKGNALKITVLQNNQPITVGTENGWIFNKTTGDLFASIPSELAIREGITNDDMHFRITPP